MQRTAIEKITRRANTRRSFEEIAEHRARKGKLNKANRQSRMEWN